MLLLVIFGSLPFWKGTYSAWFSPYPELGKSKQFSLGKLLPGQEHLPLKQQLSWALWTVYQLFVQCPCEQQGNPLSGPIRPLKGSTVSGTSPGKCSQVSKASSLIHSSASCPLVMTGKTSPVILEDLGWEGGTFQAWWAQKHLYTEVPRKEDTLGCRRSRACICRWKYIFEWACWVMCVKKEWGGEKLGVNVQNHLGQSGGGEQLGTEGENVSISDWREKVKTCESLGKAGCDCPNNIF